MVVLPEMVFYPWIAWTKQVDVQVWEASVNAHTEWLTRLQELAPAMVIGSRPVNQQGKHLNEGFLWTPERGYQAVHAKYYLPDEELFWEATWYQRGEKAFLPVREKQISIGMLICTELWFNEHARAYGKADVHLIASPRATPGTSRDKWVAGGRTVAVTSGAFSLSSNMSGRDRHGIEWAGTGWIIEPEEADVLGLTSPEHPFLTRDIDLNTAEQAKLTYPRYVRE